MVRYSVDSFSFNDSVRKKLLYKVFLQLKYSMIFIFYSTRILINKSRFISNLSLEKFYKFYKFEF